MGLSVAILLSRALLWAARRSKLFLAFALLLHTVRVLFFFFFLFRVCFSSGLRTFFSSIDNSAGRFTKEGIFLVS